MLFPNVTSIIGPDGNVQAIEETMQVKESLLLPEE